MMTLKTLFNKSVYGTIGYIKSIEDVDLLERYILYNLPVLQEFKQIIVATNYKSYPEFVTENYNLWKRYFPNCILLDSKINRGHQIGTADLDNMLVDYCKSNNIDWLCKSANDVIINPYVLSKEVDDADFYFMMGMGFAGMIEYNFDLQKVFENVFVPQTNFYIINVSKIDRLNLESDIENDICCEYMLKWCIERNTLSKFHLVPEFKYRKLIDLVLNVPIHDSSHKNILIEGICHYQFPDQDIFEI